MNISDSKLANLREYTRCKKNAIYFFKNYCYIQHPNKGKIKFNLFPFQEDTFNDLVEHKFNIINKGRQLGLSTLCAGYALWLATFHSDSNILVIATKQKTAKNMVTKFKVMHSLLPSFLKQRTEQNSALTVRFKNGSQIQAEAKSEDAARSEALSLLIIDEAAHIKGIDEIWTGAQSTLATGGNGILLSSPNGVGNLFHQIWEDAIAGEGDFNAIKLPWHLHPERDQAWRDKEDIRLRSKKKAAQENDCDFLTSGNTLVEYSILKWCKENTVMKPQLKLGNDGHLWVWDKPVAGRRYIVSADPARGDGEDNSGLQIIDLESLEQVAEYRGKIGTGEFGKLCVSLAKKYNNAILAIEKNNIGWHVVQKALELEYENVFYHSNDLKFFDVHKNATSNKLVAAERKLKPGFSTSVRSRPLLMDSITEHMVEAGVIIRSNRLISELEVFQWDGKKYAALTGYHDDLVMSLAIALFIRTHALNIRSKENKQVEAIMENIQSTMVEIPVITTVGGQTIKNPWKNINSMGEEEDLTQWL